MGVIIYNPQGWQVVSTSVDDSSARYKALNGENSLTLKFSLAEHVEVPIGSYCKFKNEYYYLMAPENLTMRHRRHFEYDIVMHTIDAKSKRLKFINPVDGRLKFSLTATPREHLQMFVENMNMRDSGWEIGVCPEHVEIVLSYNHTFCYDALVQLAEQLELDFWFDGKVVNLGKLELNKSNPLPLSYGGDGKGLKADIKRKNFTDALPVEVLYVQGGDKNINPSLYKARELHLPKGQTIAFDGTYFEKENGFDSSKKRTYVVDANGYSIRRADKAITYNSEDSLECTEIYPTKEETIDSVVEVDKNKHFYDILFSSTVDYSRYVIDGERATIVFQSGMLSGKEFDLATDSNGNLICTQENGKWRVEIVPQDIDGITMPDKNSGYLPTAKDKFKVFNIQLPDEYISDNSTKTGAEWDLLRYAVKHMYANEDQQYTITGTLDEIYAQRNWANIEGRLAVGNYISFSDKSFQAEPILIRIIGIKEYINKPHAPVIDFSNQAEGGSLIGTLNRVENNEAYNYELHQQNRNFTKRTFRAAEETLSMIAAAFDDFSTGIDPITIKTMAALFGHESLQFVFTSSRNSIVPIQCPVSYDAEKKQLIYSDASLVHMTLNVDDVTIKGNRKASDYLSWDLKGYNSAVLDNGEVSYYVYVKAPKEGTEAEYLLSETPYDMEPEGSTDYYFLVGILNSEASGSREFVTLYGFTEVLPGQITTKVIKSADGQTYFDLENNEIGGVIKFKAGSGGVENLAGLAEFVNGELSKVKIGAQNMLRNSGFTGDYLSERLADNAVLEATSQMENSPFAHWTPNGSISSIELEGIAVSGMGIEVTNGGNVSQALYNAMIAGETYVLSFKAKKMPRDDSFITITIGEINRLISPTIEWQSYEVVIKPEEFTSVFQIGGRYYYLCDLQLERGTVATAWSNSPFDNTSDRAYYNALKYLADALDGQTLVDGGLVLTNLLKLGTMANNTFEERAGVNGLYNDDDTPAFWSGGTLDKADRLIQLYRQNPTKELTDTEAANYAKFVVSHGGRVCMNDAIVRGDIYAKGGYFSGRLQLPFTYISGAASNGKTFSYILDETGYVWGLVKLTKASPTSIYLDADGYTQKCLALPKDPAFDGWILNVYFRPCITKLDYPNAVVCCNSGGAYTSDGFIYSPGSVDSHKFATPVSAIIAKPGGLLQFVCTEGNWMLLNHNSNFTYVK